MRLDLEACRLTRFFLKLQMYGHLEIEDLPAPPANEVIVPALPGIETVASGTKMYLGEFAHFGEHMQISIHRPK